MERRLLEDLMARCILDATAAGRTSTYAPRGNFAQCSRQAELLLRAAGDDEFDLFRGNGRAMKVAL